MCMKPSLGLKLERAPAKNLPPQHPPPPTTGTAGQVRGCVNFKHLQLYQNHFTGKCADNRNTNTYVKTFVNEKRAKIKLKTKSQNKVKQNKTKGLPHRARKEAALCPVVGTDFGGAVCPRGRQDSVMAQAQSGPDRPGALNKINSSLLVSIFLCTCNKKLRSPILRVQIQGTGPAVDENSKCGQQADLSTDYSIPILGEF